MGIDRSEGWDAIADEFMAVRSGIGASLVRDWARKWLPASATIVDVGCGSGVPIAKALIDDGFTVYGIDASPRLLRAFRQLVPYEHAACEAAQESRFFNRSFDGIVSIGLLFLLSADDQQRVIRSAANALNPEGRLLFSAPRQPCEWIDRQTGRQSLSLGKEAYERYLDKSGLHLIGCHTDEGGNHYFDARRKGHP